MINYPSSENDLLEWIAVDVYVFRLGLPLCLYPRKHVQNRFYIPFKGGYLVAVLICLSVGESTCGVCFVSISSSDVFFFFFFFFFFFMPRKGCVCDCGIFWVFSCTFIKRTIVLGITCLYSFGLIEPQRATCASGEDLNQSDQNFVVRINKLCLLFYPKRAQWRFWFWRGVSESSPDAHVGRYVFSRCGSTIVPVSRPF